MKEESPTRMCSPRVAPRSRVGGRSSHLRLLLPSLGTCLLLASGLLACAGAPTPSAPQRPERPAHSLLSDTRQLTFAGRRSGEGYFSRDGSQMVFQSEREPGNPFYQIYLMNRENGGVERVSPGSGKTTCGWIHPSGGRLLFASTHLDPNSKTLQVEELAAREAGTERRYAWDYDPHYDLFSVRLPTRDEAPRRLTDAAGYDAEASWSPDGRQIIFASNRHLYAADGELAPGLSDADRERVERGDLSYFVDLYIMDAGGQGVRRLTETRGYDGGPFFSPDGDRIVFRRFSEDGAKAEIYSMRTDGTDVRQLTRLGAMSWAPFYHPSGDYVIFATNLHGHANFELYLVDTEGRSDPIRVTERDGFDGLPAFSPDGHELVWTRKRAGGESQLYRAAWNDDLARQQLVLPSKSFHAVGPLLPVPSRLVPEIAPRDLRAFVDSLSSEAAGGRLTGTPGERIATSYVARVFRALGLEPAGSGGTYFHEFGFTAGVSLGPDNRMQPSGPAAAEPPPLSLDRDWRPLAFSQVGPVPASELVFAGYGIVAPAREGIEAVDDYAHLDVEGSWVLVFRYVPESLEGDARQHYQRHASLRHKAMVARDRGARGILFVSGRNAEVREQLVDLRSDASLAGTSIAVVSLSDAAAEKLVRQGSPYELSDLQSTLDERIALRGFKLAGIRLAATIDIRQQRRQGRNVLARLPATAVSSADPNAAPPPVILLGAHVDHLGHGEGAGSLAHEGEKGALHPGADDNASGVAALLEIADWLVHLRDRGDLATVREIVFAAWSGEELGLLGSSAYAAKRADEGSPAGARSEHSTSPSLAGKIAAYLNLDMVGRLNGELTLLGVDSSPVWRSLIERHNAPVGLAIQPLGDSYLPTDATTFYLKGVPILSAFTGAHADYHSPRDVPSRLDYEGIASVAQLYANIAASLAADTTVPAYMASDAPARGLPRAGLRVYLGTIPDYTNDERAIGLALSGVASGGPAERAGLRAGDIITAVNGRTIENIYDYTYALDGLRVGVEVEIVAQRGGEALRFELTPGSRD